MLKINDPVFRRDAIGFPASHAEKFKEIAALERCVILCRAPGPTCRQLLEQGYDTKGFRIHAKSCDWGPMAGFVLRDPRLNKAGTANEKYNRTEHAEAFSDKKAGAGWTASTTPLKIYEDRLHWLIQQNKIQPRLMAGSGTTRRYEGTQHHPTGISFHYCLISDAHPGIWGVYLDRSKNSSLFQQETGGLPFAYHPIYGAMYEPMLAMTNPPSHRSYGEGDFRNAITGDYDLFAVWPYEENYSHDVEDRRILGTAAAWSQREHIEHDLERNFTAAGQGTKMGNITNRIYEVCQFLNSAIGTATTAYTITPGPFPSRMVCWHSDEAARPFVNDVDLPIIGFAPSKLEIGIETIDDLKLFIQQCQEERIHVTLAEGWTLNPEPKKGNRLGAAYAQLVPQWMGGQWKTPNWYNR
jgi:hypothetical protein